MGLKEFFGIGLPRTAWREPDVNFRWRIETEQNLQREIEAILPTKRSGVTQFKALTIGNHGHGKSALINSFASVSAGRKTTVCNSASLERNVTTRYRDFQFPGKLEQCVLGDIAGLPVSEEIQPFLEDIKLILEGHIKSGYTFNLEKSISPEDESFETSPKLSDRVHCVIIVFDCREAYEMHPSIRINVRKIMDKIHSMNVPVMAVLTKADLLSSHVKHSVDAIFRCNEVRQAVLKTASQLTIPAPKVHPVVNFEQKDHTTWKDLIPILIVLRSYLSMAQLHLHNADEVVQ